MIQELKIKNKPLFFLWIALLYGNLNFAQSLTNQYAHANFVESTNVSPDISTSKTNLAHSIQVSSQNTIFKNEEIEFYQSTASKIQIIRDWWGVPHIYASSNEQCAFGLMYAQCEDNFWQLEDTFIKKLGRYAEVYGEPELANDAEVALFQCVKRAKEAYTNADPMIKAFCEAAAAGINYFILSNPNIEVRLLKRFEPWYFLLPSPNSAASHGIKGSEMRGILISKPLNQSKEGEELFLENEVKGSNALAIHSSRSIDAKSILVINPHVDFYGDDQRYEAHLISKEGLNVSGFAILGTFYIWSGFTSRTAWAHTNTGSDYEDVYLEDVNPLDSTEYKYDQEYRRFAVWQDTVAYVAEGKLHHKVFTFRKSHHGPVVAKRGVAYVTIRSAIDDDPAGYILQSLKMNLARSLREFEAAMALHQLATNTMFSDNKGNIAYWHGNRIPIRNTTFDWSLPVSGATSQTEWQGYHIPEQTLHFKNPSSGFLQNCNSSPYRAAGHEVQLDSTSYPDYMGYDPQNLRSQEMLLQLGSKREFSLDDIAGVITSKNLPVMRNWLGQIIEDYEKEVKTNPSLREKLGAVVDTLRNWNYQYAPKSTATSLAFAWHSQFLSWLGKEVRAGNADFSTFNNSTKLLTPPGKATELLIAAVKDIQDLYDTPFVEWQMLCHLQRTHTSGREKFDDSKFSIPVNAAPGIMGSLFAFNLRFTSTSKKGYGVSGNTYTAIVALGKRINVRSIVNFGQSSDSSSPHYFDQANLYARGEFKVAYYYKKDVLENAEEIYTPGQRAFKQK